MPAIYQDQKFAELSCLNCGFLDSRNDVMECVKDNKIITFNHRLYFWGENTKFWK